MKDGMTMLRKIQLLIAMGLVALTIPMAGPAMAHCDGLDGPVVSAARVPGGLPALSVDRFPFETAVEITGSRR